MGLTTVQQLSESPYKLPVLPRHVAMIMDGNGRWAKSRGMPRIMGHKRGAKTVTMVVEAAACMGIDTLTLFAFSSENWKRPLEEVTGLMDLFASVLKSERERLHQNGVKVSFVGDITRFSDKLKQAIASMEELTRDNNRLHLNIAINYGGRWDIVQAAKAIANKLAAGELSAEQIDEQSFKDHLAVVDDVDLLIRTGGENRISNFLLYQCAYSELHVTNTLWPELSLEEFYAMVKQYASRERRFGMTSEQVQALK